MNGAAAEEYRATTIGKLEKKYQSRTDTMYVYFSQEPFYSGEEMDGVLIINLGIYSNLPVGFKILNWTTNKTPRIEKQIEEMPERLILNEQ